MLNCSHSQFFSQGRSSLAATLLLSHKAITGCCIIASSLSSPEASSAQAQQISISRPGLRFVVEEERATKCLAGSLFSPPPICPLHTLFTPTSCPGQGCKGAQDVEGAAGCQGVHPGPAARHILLWRGILPSGLQPRYLWLATAGLLLHLVVSLLSCLLALHSICGSALPTELSLPGLSGRDLQPSNLFEPSQ